MLFKLKLKVRFDHEPRQKEAATVEEREDMNTKADEEIAQIRSLESESGKLMDKMGQIVRESWESQKEGIEQSPPSFPEESFLQLPQTPSLMDLHFPGLTNQREESDMFFLPRHNEEVSDDHQMPPLLKIDVGLPPLPALPGQKSAAVEDALQDEEVHFTPNVHLSYDPSVLYHEITQWQDEKAARQEVMEEFLQLPSLYEILSLAHKKEEKKMASGDVPHKISKRVLPHDDGMSGGGGLSRKATLAPLLSN